MHFDFGPMREIFNECYERSKKSGWHDTFEPTRRAIAYFRERKNVEEQDMADALEKDLEKQQIRFYIEKLALIHTEASEGIEALRLAGWDPSKTYYIIDGTRIEASQLSAEDQVKYKPEGLGSELADVVIRVADLAGLAGIDLAEEIFIKMAYNLTRSYRHGGKRA